MSLSTADRVFLYACLIDVGGLILFVGIALHLAYTKTNLMLSHLSNCPAVKIWAPLMNGGPWGRLILLGRIMGVVTMPGIYLRDGGANADDLKSFPTDLKLKLAIMQWTGWGLSLLMFGLAAVGEFNLFGVTSR
ncbi:hypothetical protein [Pseudomonas sp. SDO5591_S426]